jgi:hypothetical protein
MAYKIKQKDLSMDSNILSTKDYDIVIDLPNIFSNISKPNKSEKSTRGEKKSTIIKKDK